MKTIIALSTNINQSVIAIIRVSGSQSIIITEKLIQGSLSSQPRYLKNIYINGNFIDEAIINVYKAPNSFTGENMVELMVHSNGLIVKEIISFYLENGCSYAKKGEFLETAFLNGKITFEKGNIINEIIKSKNKLVLDMYRKKYVDRKNTNEVRKIRDLIAEIMMQSDMDVEYPEYIKTKPEKLMIKKLSQIKKTIKGQLKQIQIIEKLNKGIRIAIIGKPNSGKSTLFNMLLKKDRSIVTSIPGTTTDYIEDWIILKNDIKVTLIDTAGIRKTKKHIERKGVEKSHGIIKEADILIWLEEDRESFHWSIETEARIIEVLSKSDLKKEKPKGILNVSIKDPGSIERLMSIINNTVNEIIKEFNVDNLAFVSNLSGLKEVEKNIEEIIINLGRGMTIDMFRSTLNECLNICNGFLGETKDYNYIEQIFRSFCIGK